MEFIMNIVLAWVSVGFGIALTIIYLMRIVNKKVYGNKNEVLRRGNKFLRRWHKHLGIAFIVTSFLHGIFSSVKILSFNLGSLAILLGILLGLNYMFRKRVKIMKTWMHLHRVLSLALVLTVVIHIVEVGGPIGVENFFAIVESSIEKENADPPQNTDLGGDTARSSNAGDKESDSSLNDTDGEKETSVSATYTKEESENILSSIGTEVEKNIYADGLYYGEADAYGPSLKVEVIVNDNRIQEVNVIEHNEVNERIYGGAMAQVPEMIVEANEPIVDGISGATYTSYGIMNAVIDALEEALIDGELPEKVLVQSNRKRR